MVVDMAGDYEAQRAANIAANLELMMSLGLYQTSKQLAPSTPVKPKVTPKSGTASPHHDKEQEALQRPKRITRSASRTLDGGSKYPNRAMKRALSDQDVWRTPRRARDDFEPKFEEDSDDEFRPRRKRTSLNPARGYRDESELQRHADRLGVRIHDPKTFGPIPGIAVGTLWEKRMDCSTDAVHAPTVAGISGNENDGCWSICLSGGYEDDIDLGETFTYTGSGGRDLKGTAENPKNLRTAPQSSHQKWEGKNAALKRSVRTAKPVRVVRGYKAQNQYAPKAGYVYSGLYLVTDAWMETGKAGFKVCKFRFKRLPNQAPLPTFDHDASGENESAVEPYSALEVERSPSAAPSCASTLSELSSAVSVTSASAISVVSVDSVDTVKTAASRSRFPVLRREEFDRAQYIIISDTEDGVDDPDAEEVEEILLHLAVQPKPVKEHMSPPKRRSRRLPPTRQTYTR